MKSESVDVCSHRCREVALPSEVLNSVTEIFAQTLPPELRLEDRSIVSASHAPIREGDDIKISGSRTTAGAETNVDEAGA